MKAYSNTKKVSRRPLEVGYEHQDAYQQIAKNVIKAWLNDAHRSTFNDLTPTERKYAQKEIRNEWNAYICNRI